MAQSLLRKTLAVFGLGGTTDDFEEFGSTAAAATNYTKDIETIQQLAAWSTGWRAALIANKAPILQDMNAWMYVHSYLLAYLFQEGIAEWDAGTTYNKGSVVKSPYTGSSLNTQLYGSLVDSNTNNALPVLQSDANWQYLGNLADIQADKSVMAPVVRGLSISKIANPQNHIIFDAITLIDTHNNIVSFGNSIFLLDITVSGLGGLDTGTVANNTWYYVWVISNGTLVNGIYSLSKTAPTMPAGYTYKMLVSRLYYDGAIPGWRKLIQVGDTVYYGSPVPVVSNDTTHISVPVTTDISTAVPPDNDAWKVLFSAFHQSVYSGLGSVTFSVQLVSPLMPSDSTTIINAGMYGSTVNMGNQLDFLTGESPDDKITWQADSTSTNRTSYTTYIYVRGYQLKFLMVGQ